MYFSSSALLKPTSRKQTLLFPFSLRKIKNGLHLQRRSEKKNIHNEESFLSYGLCHTLVYKSNFYRITSYSSFLVAISLLIEPSRRFDLSCFSRTFFLVFHFSLRITWPSLMRCQCSASLCTHFHCLFILFFTKVAWKRIYNHIHITRL